MRLPFFGILALALLAGGCSSTARFNRQAAKARTFDMNVHAMRGPVTIYLNTLPEPQEAEFFTMQADSAFWIDEATGLPASASLAAIEKVSVRDRATGLAYGSIIGTSAGIGVGAVIADRTRYPVSVAIGYLGGMLAGYLIGYDRHYIFEDGPER